MATVVIRATLPEYKEVKDIGDLIRRLADNCLVIGYIQSGNFFDKNNADVVASFEAHT